jgi:WD40 repeat protein
VREYRGAGNTIRDVVFLASDPPRLVAKSKNAVVLWELGRSDPVTTWPIHHDLDWSAGLTASRDGRWLAACPGGRLTVWDVSAGTVGRASELGAGEARTARFAGPPEHLCVLRRDPTASRSILTTESWAVPTSEQTFGSAPVAMTVLSDSNDPFMATGTVSEAKSLSLDGRRLGLCFRWKTLDLWDIENGDYLGRVSLRGGPWATAFSPDVSKVVVDAGTTLYVHDARTREPLTKWKIGFCYTPGLGWSPDSRLLARTDGSTTVRIYDADNGHQISALSAKRGRHMCVAFAPDGLTYAAGTFDGLVRVWDLE